MPKNTGSAFNQAKFWLWLPYDCSLREEQWPQIFEQLRNAGIENLLVQVYTGDRAYFKNHLMCHTPCEALEILLPLAEQFQVNIHAWIWVLMNQSPLLLKNHPDWYMVNRLGQSTVQEPPYVSHYQWLCPSNAQVRQYLLKLIDELAVYDQLAGIHLDFIRFPDVILPPGIQPRYGLQQTRELPQFDYCYCPRCVESFQQQYHLRLPGLDGELPSEWNEFRYKQISNLVRALHLKIKGRGKISSAAVFPTPEIARKLVRQNWEGWPVDLVFPMIYQKFYHQEVEWISTAVQQGVKVTLPNQHLIAGLYFGHLALDQLEKAVENAMNAGAQGIAFFSFEYLQKNPQYWDGLKNLAKIFNLA